MISFNIRCPDCGTAIRVFPLDQLVDCDNPYCGESFRVIREDSVITLKHLYFKKRPHNETRLDMFTQELLT